MFQRSFMLLILLIGLMACTPAMPAEQPAPSLQPAQAEEHTPLPATQIPTSEPTAAPTVEPTLTAVPPAPVSKYQIDIQFDYATRRASVEQTVAYANNSSAALDEIALKIEPVNFAGVFELKSLSWQDGSLVQSAEWEGAVLRFPLPAPLLPGEVISFALAYQLYLPRMVENENLRPPIFGYTDRQVNLVDWYPFVPPYTDAGWMIHARGNYGEHLTYDIADYEVNLLLQNAPANLQIAASSAPEVDGDWLRYRLPAARNFVLSLSPDYQVQQGTAGNVTVYSYAFPVHGTANTAVLQTTINALNLYQELFGPYPHDTMSAVEADFWTAWNTTGCIT
jgi:hypothetical protein